MKGYQFYRSLLNKEEKKLYDRLYKGWTHHCEWIEIPRSALILDYKKVIDAVLYDNPLFFYAKFSKPCFVLSGKHNYIVNTFAYSEWEIKELENEIEAKISAFAKTLKDKCSVEDKLKAIYSFLGKDTKYQNTDSPEEHTIIGGLHGRACCSGYAAAIKLLCDASGVKALIAKNDTHAWNIVYSKGKSYNVDFTSDLSYLSKNADKTPPFFMVPDSVIKTIQDKPDIYPLCT